MKKSKKTKPRSEKQLRAAIDEAFANASDDRALLRELDELARERFFGGLTWYWGPLLYRRQRATFRPFILNHFSTWNGHYASVRWKGEVAAALDPWLQEVDAAGDVALFRRLYPWKSRRLNAAERQAELLRRFTAATGPERAAVLSRFNQLIILDEPTALELYRIDAKLASRFIAAHLPTQWHFFGGEKRQPWDAMTQAARDANDDRLADSLYRRQVPLKRWEADALKLCEQERDAETLVKKLDTIHPQGYALDLGGGMLALLQNRGREVLPYVLRRSAHTWNGWSRNRYKELRDLAFDRDWPDLWAALIRTGTRPQEFQKEVRQLVDGSYRLSESDRRRRLLSICGVSREWNWRGVGLARINGFDDETANAVYDRFPELVRGPLRLNLQMSWMQPLVKFTERAIGENDDELVDFLASRVVPQRPRWRKAIVPLIEQLVEYYEALRETGDEFPRRAAIVLGHIPPYVIQNYNTLVRENALARLLFERSSESLLENADAILELLESPQIFAQALAFRALALDDERARALAQANLRALAATLLRSLHRRTRLWAIGALRNAASEPEAARFVLERARGALHLPDRRYPKDALVGLVGYILHRFPELREAGETPVVYERGRKSP